MRGLITLSPSPSIPEKTPDRGYIFSPPFYSLNLYTEGTPIKRNTEVLSFRECDFLNTKRNS